MDDAHVNVTGGRVRLIDLSDTLANETADAEPLPHRIDYIDHAASAASTERIVGAEVWPEGRAGAIEQVSLSTHAGTHVDAPYHYGPAMRDGTPARTIDQVPLTWCFGDGFVLNMSHRRAGDGITESDVRTELERIEYTVKPLDIALVRTDASKAFGQPGYELRHPGLMRSATAWLVGQGVRLIGIDAWGLDRPFDVMAREAQAGDRAQFWGSHFFGLEQEYCQIEKLVNLDAIPVAHGFQVAAFPVKLARAGGSWARVVALVRDS